MPTIANGGNATIAVTAGQILTVLCQNGAEFTYENPVGTRVIDSGANNVFGPYAAAGNVKVTSVIGPLYYEVATPTKTAPVPYDPANVAITGGSATFTGPFASRGITDNATSTEMTLTSGVGAVATTAVISNSGIFSAASDGGSTIFLQGTQHIFRRGSSGAFAEFGRFSTAGRLLIGTPTDDGVNLLQVAGPAKANTLLLTAAAPTAAAAQVAFGATTATTVGAAGGAAALPATPLGYLIINVAGTAAKIPYYNT